MGPFYSQTNKIRFSENLKDYILQTNIIHPNHIRLLVMAMMAMQIFVLRRESFFHFENLEDLLHGYFMDDSNALVWTI